MKIWGNKLNIGDNVYYKWIMKYVKVKLLILIQRHLG